MNTDITDKSTLQSSWTDSITTIERKTHYVVASYTMYTNTLVRERNHRESQINGAVQAQGHESCEDSKVEVSDEGVTGHRRRGVAEVAGLVKLER